MEMDGWWREPCYQLKIASDEPGLLAWKSARKVLVVSKVVGVISCYFLLNKSTIRIPDL